MLISIMLFDSYLEPQSPLIEYVWVMENRQQDQFSIVEDGRNIPPIGPDKVLVFTNTNEQNHDETKRKYDLMMFIFPKKSGLVFSTVDLSFAWGNSEIRIMLVIEALLVVESPSKDWRSSTASSWNRTAPGRCCVGKTWLSKLRLGVFWWGCESKPWHPDGT